MNESDIRAQLIATGEEILDEQGQVVGYVSMPARFKLNRKYLALGGFLVVVRDEETGEYVATEFDALPHPKTRQPYPAGHSEQVWRTANLEEAVRRVHDCLLSQPEA